MRLKAGGGGTHSKCDRSQREWAVSSPLAPVAAYNIHKMYIGYQKRETIFIISVIW